MPLRRVSLPKWTRFRLLLLLALVVGTEEVILDCPNKWEMFQQACYKFIIYPPKTFQDARLDCQMSGAGLVSVNDAQEQSYLSEWIQRLDGQRYTNPGFFKGFPPPGVTRNY